MYCSEGTNYLKVLMDVDEEKCVCFDPEPVNKGVILIIMFINAKRRAACQGHNVQVLYLILQRHMILLFQCFFFCLLLICLERLFLPLRKRTLVEKTKDLRCPIILADVFILKTYQISIRYYSS
jgi:hypothetical protein